MRYLSRIPAILLVVIFFGGYANAYEASGKLEIHYINVGQGGCTLIVGPDGTRILYDFGGVSGNRDIVPYLQSVVGLNPSDGIHYTIVSHRDSDHYKGYKDVIKAGYDVLVANYDSGSEKTSTNIEKYWLTHAKGTTAGPVRSIPVGLNLSLGDGAELIVMAANGHVLGQQPIKITNENDQSVSLVIRYNNFHYVLDGDLGSGPEDCTDHGDFGQKYIQPIVAQAAINQGFIPAEYGVDVMHLAHHGSESSTSSIYYNLVKPEVALVNVGIKQGSYLHPREDVVDKVLLGANRASCVKAPAVKNLFQTEDGKEGSSSTGRTSNSGLSIGDIKLVTDGRTGYSIQGNNRVHGGSKEAVPANKVWKFKLDEDE